MRQRGFTLLETLVALVVATAAAAIILSLTRAQYQRAIKEREHALAVTQLMNNAARLGQVDWRAWPAVSGENLLRLDGRTRTSEALDPGPIDVRNFLLASNDLVPPIAIAYTPLQQFGVGESSGRYSLSFVAASLVPPDNSLLPNQFSADLKAASQVNVAEPLAKAGTAPGAPPTAVSTIPAR